MSPRRPRFVSLLLVLVTVLVACGPGTRTQAGPAPRGATRSRPAPGELRLQTHAGGVVDFGLPAGDTSVTLQLRTDAQAEPRTTLHFSQGALRRFVELLDALTVQALPDEKSRDMWGVEIDDAAGELALNVTRVARRTSGPIPLDSFAIAARTHGAPLVLLLTAEEFGDVTGAARSYASFLAMVAKAAPGTARPYFEFEVDDPARQAAGGCIPYYPTPLRRRHVTGDVRVEFVVGPNGRVEEESYRVLMATDSAFAISVRRSLSCFRFKPARVGGVPVRVLATQLFTFDISS